jgi:hypothetical protein
MLLGSVIFLTQLWGYSVLHAGLAIAPGPLMAAITAAGGGRVTARLGPRTPAIAGGLFSAIGFAWALAFVGVQPNYAADWLPGFLLGGIGVGLVLSSLPSAATAGLPPDRFATGTAVFAMSRQIGAAIGVAILVAILGDAAGSSLLGALQGGWAFMLGAALATAALASALPRAAGGPAPATAAAPVTATTS